MKALLVIILLLQIILICISVFSRDSKPEDIETYRAMAVKLEYEKLYPQAISLYEKYAEAETNPVKRGAAYLKIADLYFEHVHRYDEALAHYYMAQNFTSRTDIRSEIERKTVTCLDNLGRGKDARKKLEQTALLDPQRHKNSTAVAQIGNRTITMSELDEEIAALPESMKSEFDSPDKKLDFLRQYIQSELLYEKGLRQNYDKSNDVLQAMEKAKRNIMSQKVIAENIGNLSISQQELSEYYEKNKEKFRKDDVIPPLSECARQAADMLQQELFSKKAGEFMTELFRQSNVKIHENMFRSAQ